VRARIEWHYGETALPTDRNSLATLVSRQRHSDARHTPLRAIAEKFHPEKIILFGSHAHGTPHEDSDVDILVVMAARNEIDQAVKIRLAVAAPFPMDLIVRTPEDLRWRLEAGDSFMRDIVAQGKVLYEQADAGVAAKSGGRLPHGKKPRAGGGSVGRQAVTCK